MNPADSEARLEALQQTQRDCAEVARLIAESGAGVPTEASALLRKLSFALDRGGVPTLARLAESMASARDPRALSRANDALRVLAAELIEDSGAEACVTELMSSLGDRGISADFPAGRTTVESAARLTGKSAELAVEIASGQEPALDALRDPLLHLLRNAVDHGIEEPSERRRKGKPETGTIVLRVAVEGDTVRIEVEDDGRGVDFVGALERARRLGLPPASAENLIFLPGFSTRESANELSGRGIGLDAARQSVRALGGELRLERSNGAGSLFRIRVPATALRVRAA